MNEFQPNTNVNNYTEVILSSIASHIAVIDQEGEIITVNKAWEDFSKENFAGQTASTGVGNNYLEVCRRSARNGDEGAQQSLAGIQAVLCGELEEFYLEYPCHSQDQQRWFAMRVRALTNEIPGAVIVHEDFTEAKMTRMKLAESMKSQMEAILIGQESERERIAAELHDSINPLLSVASLNADSLLPLFEENKELPIDQLNNIIGLLENAVRGIKEISSNLSPALLKSFGLSNALEQLCKKVRQTGQLQIDYHSHNAESRIDSRVELVLYRIAQELLNNILRHADATEVEVQLIRHTDSIVLMVSDNGIGFDVDEEHIKTNGFGFKNITSRVQSLNGVLRIDSGKGKGTTVVVELPL